MFLVDAGVGPVSQFSKFASAKWNRLTLTIKTIQLNVRTNMMLVRLTVMFKKKTQLSSAKGDCDKIGDCINFITGFRCDPCFGFSV